MSEAVGVLTQLGVDTANPVTKRFDFMSNGLVTSDTLSYLGGLHGTLDDDVSRVRKTRRTVQGPVRLQPNAAEWALLLPWMTGDSGSGSPAVTYTPANTLPTRYVEGDAVSKVLVWDHVFVNRFQVSASEGQPLALTLDVVGVDETIGAAATFPALTIDSATGPFIFSDCVLSIGGVGAPTLNAPTKTAGGTLPDNTYYYVLTATTAAGTTTQSNEVTTTTSTQKVVLTWSPVSGATGYKVYRSLVSATYSGSHLLKSVSGGGTLTYTDDGGDSLVSGAPAGSNTTGAAAFTAKSLNISVDNKLDTGRFLNSLTLSTGIVPTRRMVTCRPALPFGDAVALYDTGATATAVTATFTNGGAVLTFRFPNAVFPRQTPPVSGHQEIMLPLNATCYGSGAVKSYYIDLNPGP